MPELPEVETIARTLASHLAGRTVRDVVVRERRLRTPVASDLEDRLRGCMLTGIRRAGKALVLDVGVSGTLLLQLGMTGRLTLRDAGQAPREHDHAWLVLDDERLLVFNDVRRFGSIRLVAPGDLPRLLGGGLDPFAPGFTAEAMFEATRRKRVRVKTFLMDQRVLLGVGNIYANEILFHAGVRPSRRVGRLARGECGEIVRATRVVLTDAIRCGGSSISDYRDGFDRFGTYQEHHHVYGRAARACRRCGVPITRMLLAGRSSFYCRGCQR